MKNNPTIFPSRKFIDTRGNGHAMIDSHLRIPTRMTIKSTNTKFWCDLINWINAYPDGSGTALILDTVDAD